MNYESEKEIVEIFLYKHLAESEPIPSNGMRLDVLPLTSEEEFRENKISEFVIRNSFQLMVENVLITGIVSQKNKLFNRLVLKEGDVTKQEVEKLTEPLILLIQRLIYDVTEITFDSPGIKVNFQELSTMN